jgi:nucleoid DNA-binding protein
MAGDKNEKMTKAKLVATISGETELTKQQVEGVLDSLHSTIKKQLGRRGPGEFTIPKIVKLKVIKKKATKARMGRNPATGEPIKIPAKRAHKVVKATVLKATKDLV